MLCFAKVRIDREHIVTTQRSLMWRIVEMVVNSVSFACGDLTVNEAHFQIRP